MGNFTINTFVHVKKTMNKAVGRDFGHLDCAIDLACLEGLESLEIDDLNPQKIAHSPSVQVLPSLVRRSPGTSCARSASDNNPRRAPIKWLCPKKCGVPPAVQRSPGRWKFPRCVLIKWLCRVSVGLKIHAVSSSDCSSRPASHNTGPATTRTS